MIRLYLGSSRGLETSRQIISFGGKSVIIVFFIESLFPGEQVGEKPKTNYYSFFQL